MNILKVVFTIGFALIVFYGNTKEPKPGFWQGILILNETTKLPFVFSIDTNDHLTIYNAEEKIEMNKPTLLEDSILYSFKAFNTYLIFTSLKKSLKGFYVYPDRKNHSRIAFYANYIGQKKPSCSMKTDLNISGKWKTTFSPESEDAYPAVGSFTQTENGNVTGTFLTETGDYRFLDGYLQGNKLTLSCFDGSHAFLFKGKVTDGNLNGIFYSGSHWETDWVAERNNSYKLRDPDSLTYLIKKELKFEHPDTNNIHVSYPNVNTKGKVVIIQILGTWCPNCLDETNFYKDIYESYHKKGLEIIAIAYEYPKNKRDQIERVKRYINNNGIPYQILIGGHASKKEASKDFNMLNEITSFPTSIIINRKGEVVNIHTGFNGPGTGEVYDDYVTTTRKLIEKLLHE